MRTMNKYAVRFPELETERTQHALSVYSENKVAQTEKSFLSTFNALGSLAGYVIQKNRTGELRKQLRVQKEALDVEIDNKKEQLKIKYEEESERIKARLKTEKQEMELAFQRLKMETVEQAKEFQFSYEEYMKTNQLFYAIIRKEKTFLEDIQPYINFLGEEFCNRREYIMYCDLQRKSLELVNIYLKQMI